MRRFLLFLAAFGLAATQVEAEPEVIDDKALLRSFEAQVGTLHKESVGLSAPELRRILRTEPKTDLALEEVATRDPLTRPELYRKAKAATLFVGHLYLCNDCDRLHGSAAGGVIVSPDGLALTNFHVLDFARARAYGAMTADGKAYAVGEVLAASRKHDVALIRLQEAQNLPTLPLAVCGEDLEDPPRRHRQDQPPRRERVIVRGAVPQRVQHGAPPPRQGSVRGPRRRRLRALARGGRARD